MNDRLSSLLHRIPEGLRTGKLRDAVRSAFEGADGYKTRADSIRADRKLSDIGKAEAVTAALKSSLPRLGVARDQLKAAKTELAAMKSAVRFKAIDKTDLVGGILQQEIRAMLRNLPPAERLKMLLRSSAQRLTEAALNGPKELSGLSAEHFAMVEKQHLEKQFGSQLAEIEEFETAVQEADSALQVARMDLQSTSGMRPDVFEKIAAPIESRANSPWLRRDRDANGSERILVIVPGESSPKDATPEQLATGIYFKDFNEYRANRGLMDRH